MNDPVKNLLLEAWADLRVPDVAWQLVIIAAAVLIAWLVNRAAHLERIEASGLWRFGVGGLKRILGPLVALAIVFALREALGHWIRVEMLNLAVPLLWSMVLIRAIAYLMRQVLAPGGGLAFLEKALATVVWVAFALHISGALPGTIELLDGIGFSIGRNRVSLWLLLQGAFWVVTTLMLALWVAGLLEARLMRADNLDSSLRVAFSRMAKSLLLVLAVLVVLPLVGIDLTVLSVFGGALGVGLGFGLQKIASNYVSGFIILLDRSVKLGDVVAVDNFQGAVTGITSRFSVLRALDGREALVPNEMMITQTVVNHTHSNRRIRAATQVQVGYDSDVDRVSALLVSIAAAHPRVLADPAPAVLLTRFADSGIDVELGFWVADPENGTGGVRSDLNRAILEAFRREGIEIPYPQRVVRTLPGPESVA